MKKKILSVLITIFALCSCMFTLTACGHEHSYTTSVTAPSCTEQGYTTYFCECGDSYTDNFINAFGHEFTNYVSDNNATCTENGTETATCNHTDCQKTNTRTQEHSAFGHEFTNYEYNNDADCEKDGTETAICNNNCGESDTRTKTGTAFTHSYGDWVSIGNGQHKKTCSNDNSHTVIESCSGGTATCTEKAVCKDCNVAYGSVKHTYNQKIAENKYLKTSATCDSKAIYFYSCSCGDKGTTTFEYGSALGHSYGDWVSIGNGQHKKVCANNSSHVITENCSGGTATCTEKAVCAHCKTVYGDFLEHSYDDTGYCVCGDKDENYYTQGITFMAVAGGYTVGWYNGSSTTLVIPDYYNGEKVVAISKTALNNCQSLKKIIIGNNVETIPEGVFRDCTSLQELTIPFINDIFGKLFGEGSYYSYDTDSFIPDSTKGIKCSFGTLHQVPADDAKWCVSGMSKWVETSSGIALWQGEWVSPYTTGKWTWSHSGVTCYTYYAATSLKLPVYYIPKSLNKVTISNQQISTLSDDYKTYFKNVDFTVSVLKKYPVLSAEIVGSSEVYYGEFNYSDYKIKTTRTDGLVENTYLRKEYLSETDQVKLNTLGSHSITINYDGREINWNIVIKPIEFSGLSFEDKTFTYDGQAKGLAVTGLPSGAQVTYSNNNQKETGTYTVTATISLENYKTTTITATLTIVQRELNVKFSGVTTIKYDGNSHKELMVSATNVVDGDSVNLTIAYSGEMIEVGDYIATAILAPHKNYKLTINNTCSIKITRETHTITFKQAGRKDIIKYVLDLADLTDIPEVTPVTGYTVVWENVDLTNVTTDITVNAIITINQYTISFVANNGQTLDSITQDYNTTITLPRPTWTERSFVGWFDKSLTTQFTKTTMPAENITLYAKWINYEVSLSCNSVTAISCFDNINDATLFGINAVDTDGSVIEDIKIRIISGSLTTGNKVSIQIIATGLYGQYSVARINDIAVYGLPEISYDNTKDYINYSNSLVASLFSATATDTYGSNLTVSVSIKEDDYKSGDLITIVLMAKDRTNNVKTIEINDVKYYGKPIVEYNKDIASMKKTDVISNEFFGVTAKDSFGEQLSVITELYSGTFAGGNTITVKSYATDSKGNVGTIYYQVKVYGSPKIEKPLKTDFSIEDNISIESLGVVAFDSFNVAISNLSLSYDVNSVDIGKIIECKVTAVDFLGNSSNIVFNIKIYGNPTITYDEEKVAIKDTDIVSPALFSVEALDSFGETLVVAINIESGELVGGSTIICKISAKDSSGNISTVYTQQIRVYSALDINLTYNAANSNRIKIDSKGEEFNALATDSFGEACAISIIPAEGSSLQGGNTISMYLIAIDKVGNTFKSGIISEKKVYAKPVITCVSNVKAICETLEGIYSFFYAEDSFGKDVLFEVEIVGEITSRNFVTIKVTAQDVVGNITIEEYPFEIFGTNQACVTLDYNGGTADFENYYILTQGQDFVLPYEIEKEGYLFNGWAQNNTLITNDIGKSISTFAGSGFVVLKAIYTPIEYSITYNLMGGTMDEENPTKYNIENRITSLNSPYLDDCTFIGWFSNGEKIESLIGMYGDMELYAKWEHNIFVINQNKITGLTDYGQTLKSLYIPNELNGIEISTIGKYAISNSSKNKIVTEKVYIPSTVKSIEGCAFIASWAYDYSKTNNSLVIYCEAKEKPSGFSSSWNYYLSGLQYPVVWGYTGELGEYVFETNGGNTISNIETDALLTLPMPTKAGFVFEGWYDNAELSGNVVRAPYSSDSNRVLYAKWSSDTVAIDRRSQFGDAKIATANSGYTLWNGNYSRYSFTPSESKSYRIYTTGSCSTYIYLLDEDGHVIKYVIENGEYGYGTGYNYDNYCRNSTMTISLTAGKTYYIYIGSNHGVGPSSGGLYSNWLYIT